MPATLRLGLWQIKDCLWGGLVREGLRPMKPCFRPSGTFDIGFLKLEDNGGPRMGGGG